MEDASALQRALVDELVRRGHIASPSVEAAFRAVPRHLFLPDVPLEDVYRDQVIVTKMVGGQAVSSSSQPYGPLPDEIVVAKRWNRLVLDWPAQAGRRASAPR
ncbi:MAG: hypothetical protein HYU25_16655 [Candidatus Rokubacteria bacterium]|nr:hypothetical protein [Candidatus Rokubacteria bacterium]